MGTRVLLLDSSRTDKYKLLALFRALPNDVKITAVRDVTQYDYQYNAFELELSSSTWDDVPVTHMSYYLDTSVSWSEITLERNVGKPSENTPDYAKPVYLSGGKKKSDDNLGFACSCWLEYTGERHHKSTCSLKNKKNEYLDLFTHVD